MTFHKNGPGLNKNTAEADRFWYNNLPLQYDPDYVGLFDDFIGIAVDETNDWTAVEDSGASLAIEADTVGGWLDLLSAATTEGDGASIQSNEIFAVATGRYLWAEAVVKFHDADDCDFFFGFTENFATNPEAVLTASNRIGFQIVEGDASVLVKTESSDTETSSDTEVDAADDTEMTLGIRCIGTGVVEFYVNRVLKVTHTTNIPTANLAIALAHISGSATGTFILHCDYIGAWMTR